MNTTNELPTIKTIAVTGPRPEGLGGYAADNPIKLAVKSAFKDVLSITKPEMVYIGMALGVDQWCAEVCVDVGQPWTACQPFEDMDSIWPNPSREHYRNLLAKATEVVNVTNSRGFAAWKMFKRNEFMVDKADVLFAVWDGNKEGGTYDTVQKAQKAEKPIIQYDWNQ